MRETIYKNGRRVIEEDDCTVETASRPIAATKSSLHIVFKPEYDKLKKRME